MTAAPLRLTGRTLRLARLAWLVVAVPTVGVLLLALAREGGLPGPLANFGWTTETFRAASQQLGWPVWVIPVVIFVSSNLGRLSFVAAGLVLFWRSSEGMALFTSLTLLTFAVTAGGPPNLPPNVPALAAVLNLLQLLGQSCFVLFLYVFPNGRFVPGWMRWPTLLAIAGLNLIGRLPDIQATLAGQIVVWFSTLWVLLSILPSQIYRYLRISTVMERQQTKLVVVAIALFLVGGAGSWLASDIVLPALAPGAIPPPGTSARLLYDFALAELQVLPTVAVPLTLGVAILRYRLWDIDVLIRRTLIYSTLTAFLAVAYFGSVLVLQNLFQTLTGEGQNTLATVLSTLIIAALFGPVRRRIQRVIDRRFYRQKYNAAHTLAAFSAQARDVVALEQLSAQLVAAVAATMQPKQVSLWLASDAHPTHEGRSS